MTGWIPSGIAPPGPPSLTLLGGLDLAEQPNRLPPVLRMHRQHVDVVSPVVGSPVGVAKQLRGDRVTVSLVADQNVAEVVAGFGVECLEERSEVVVSVEQVGHAAKIPGPPQREHPIDRQPLELR
jgi:hypothetical protein